MLDEPCIKADPRRRGKEKAGIHCRTAPSSSFSRPMPAPDPDAERERDAETAVWQIYRELDERRITRSCTLRTECCRFRLTGKVPLLTRGEALVAMRTLRAAGRKSVPTSPDGECPILDPTSARCRIYEGRPFGCRTHFCDAAGGPYARRDVIDLIRRLEEIDRALSGRGAMSLPAALSAVIRK